MKNFLVIALLCMFAVVARGQAALDTLFPTSLIIPAKYASEYDTAETVYLPKGFQCTLYYTQPGYWGPRMMAIDPSGTLCITDMALAQVLALPDTDHDNVADTAIQIAYDDSNANSIAFYQGALYTAASDFVFKYEHPNAAGLYVDSSRFIDNIPNTPQGNDNHYTRTILFDSAQGVIFLSVGSPCDVCWPTDSERGTVLEFNIDGTGRRVYANGLRNAVGLGMDPATGDVWINVAERNYQGADIPPEFASHLVDGAFYGWPIAFGDHLWDNFQADSESMALLPLTYEDTLRVADMQVPDISFPAHSTPLSLAFYRKQKFPAIYQGNMFTTLHGSSPGIDGRIIADGSKIERSQNVAGQWITTDFATGFLTDSINYVRWARPTGIIIDSTGDMYFSSDNTGPHSTPAVFKISYIGQSGVASSPVALPSLNLYPNPASDHVTIQLSQYVLGSAISIVDMLGREVFHTTISFGAPLDVDIHDLGAGIYCVRASLNSGSIVKPFIVTR